MNRKKKVPVKEYRKTRIKKQWKLVRKGEKEQSEIEREE